MKKLFRTMPAVVLAVLLTGCGQGTQETMNAGYEETANAETEAAPGSGTGTAGEETDAGTESVGPDETASAWRYQGSGTVTGSDALTEGQQEILLEFMDAYYQSMAELEVKDCSGLFIEDGGHEQFRAYAGYRQFRHRPGREWILSGYMPGIIRDMGSAPRWAPLTIPGRKAM